MGYRKYAKDWTVHEEIDGRGKRVRRAVYEGPLYEYELPCEARRKASYLFACLCLVQWVLFVTSLCFPLGTMGQFYVLVPYAVRLLPLFYLTMAVWTFLFAKTPLKREQNDGLFPRMSHSLVFMVVFGVVAFVAAIVSAIVFKNMRAADIYLFVAMPVQLALDALMLRLRRATATRRIGK